MQNPQRPGAGYIPFNLQQAFIEGIFRFEASFRETFLAFENSKASKAAL